MEADVLARELGLGPRERVLDLACGHGRHARVLAQRVGVMVGVDRSAAYLRKAIGAEGPGGPPHPDRRRRFAPRARLWRARPPASPLSESGAPPPAPPRSARGEWETHPSYVRGDVRGLPFRDRTFDAAYSWYSSLFMFDDATNAACLAEAARVLRAGGRLLVHHANPAALALRPADAARRTLADGSVVEETSAFDAAAGVDRCARRLVRRSGAVLAATAELRYYNRSEWGPLADAAGLRLVHVNETPQDLIVLLEKPA